MTGFARVVIVGGGFAGLNVALGLRYSPFEITVVDKMNHHLFQPLLYQVATAGLSESDISSPIREILGKYQHMSVLLAEVTEVDKEKNVVHLNDGKTLPFDYLVLAPGTHHSYFGHDKWEPFAPGLKTLEDAIKIREKILLAFEEAEKAPSLDLQTAYLRFVVVGGGPTGVEMAGAIAEIARSLIHDFRRIHPQDIQVFLIEGGKNILPSFAPSLSQKAKKTLAKMGVKVLTDTLVTDIHQDGVVTKSGELLKAKTVIWAAGNQAVPLVKTLGMPLDRQGRVQVEKDLSLPGYSHIFVIGDAAVIPDNPLPAIAPTAIQQGRYVAGLLRKKGKKRKPFRYFDKGQLATIGKTHAVGSIRGLNFSGFVAWLVWTFVHIFYLIDFRSRLLVMIEWAFWYMTGSRGSRIIPTSVEKLEKP